MQSFRFQSMCLARIPLIQSHLSKVPFPVYCNDIDISATYINPRQLNEPTDLSLNIIVYKIFKLFNKLFKDNGEHLRSYEFVEQIDAVVDFLKSG